MRYQRPARIRRIPPPASLLIFRQIRGSHYKSRDVRNPTRQVGIRLRFSGFSSEPLLHPSLSLPAESRTSLFSIPAFAMRGALTASARAARPQIKHLYFSCLLKGQGLSIAPTVMRGDEIAAGIKSGRACSACLPAPFSSIYKPRPD